MPEDDPIRQLLDVALRKVRDAKANPGDRSLLAAAEQAVLNAIGEYDNGDDGDEDEDDDEDEDEDDYFEDL